MNIDTLVAISTLLIGVVGISIALIQLRSGQKDAKNARIADLSWQIYLRYDDETIRQGRRALDWISRHDPIPVNGTIYQEQYISNSDNCRLLAERLEISWWEISRVVTSILRYYHQIGILIDKKLIDPDFVFPLIGPALETGRIGILAATDCHQTRYLGVSGGELGPRRKIYANAPKLYDKYLLWKKKNED